MQKKEEGGRIFLRSETVVRGKKEYTFEFYAEAKRNPEKEKEFGQALLALILSQKARERRLADGKR